MEMFLFVVYAISAVVVGAVMFGVKADGIKTAIEKGLREAAVEQGYSSADEMPGYILVTARIVAWAAVLALPVIPVVNTVLTFRLARKVYRRVTAG